MKHDPTHYLHVEVTVAACIATGDGRPLGQNMVDCTLGFDGPCPEVPADVTDEWTNHLLHQAESKLLAAIAVVIPQLGLIAEPGAIENPMAQGGVTVATVLSLPVRVYLDTTPTGERLS